MKSHYLIKLLFIFIVSACQNIDSRKKSVNLPAEQLYSDATSMISEFNCDSALVLLKHAFDEGLENPMRIITDSNFYFLVENPKCRTEVRVLLKEFTTENTATMVRDDEPGKQITVTGIILDEFDGLPVENVIVEIVQSDSSGLYFSEKSMFNPRLFAYLRTDKEGQFTVNTIRPGSYLDDDGNPVPAHMHFTLEKDGYRVYASEFTFDDDPIFKAKGNVDLVPVAIKNEEDKQTHYKVEINFQREQ